MLLVCHIFLICSDSVCRCLSSLCLAHPVLAKENFISPLLAELMDASSPNKAWLLPYLCPSHSLACVMIPKVILIMKQLLGPSRDSPCGDDLWPTVCSITLAVLKVVEQLEEKEKSIALSIASAKSLVGMCVEATHSRSTWYRQQVSDWMELIARVLSSCAKYADTRYNISLHCSANQISTLFSY